MAQVIIYLDASGDYTTAYRGGGAGPARCTVRISPASPRQVAMPAQQCGRGDEERGPAVSGQQARQRGQPHPIGGLQQWPGDLSAQHHDLDLFGVVPTRKENQSGGEAPDDQVEQRPHHGLQP
ncbi:hypothetical protein [Acrocarpospora sp. B8E8]|uniref:hypothetical protein n=1 Tax=Acrocarpospora sp. B8E8 TaxID=3153572 RepID=UPI00325F410E